MEQKIYELLQQYQDCKKSVNLPLKIRLFFSTLEQMMGKNSNLSQSKQQMIDSSYVNSFQKHSEIQKITFMLKLMQQVSNFFKENNKSGPNSNSSLPPPENLNVINNIETTCQIQSINFGLSSWSKAKFKLDKFTRKVDIANKKRTICLNLQQYLVRKSKKHKSTIAFEAANNSVSSDCKKLLVYFSDAIFQQLEKEIFQSTAQAHKNHILRWEQTESQNDKGRVVDKSLVFLNSEQITSFLQYKSLVLERLTGQNMHFKTIHNKKDGDSNLKVFRSSKISKIFKIEFKVDKQAQDLKKQLTYAYQNKFKFRVQKQVVEQFSKKYHAIYDKYLFSGQVYDQINISEQGSLDKCIFFSKGIQNTLTSNMIEFILIQVKQMGMESICTVYASLGVKNDVPQQLPILFMLQFFEMIQRGKQEQMMMERTQQQDFYSIINDQMNDDDFSLDVGRDAIQGYSSRKEYQDNLKDVSSVQITSKYRNIRVIPLDLTPIQLEHKTLHQYAFQTDWKRIQKRGGLLCINPITNSQQKKVIKKVIASIGNNVFKIIRNGANLVNMCLPVSIFKKQSHLKTIARNFSYVPLILDKFQHESDQLQRFKSCIAFVISTCNLSISVQKPFNPILGETYQCWIGGCPLYFEQISHHPPISTFYFKGRGWTISGCIQPKISANGLNGGKCWSQKLNYIQFQDKSRVCFLLPKMLFNNLIIGDREFHFIDKFLVYDMKNNYFAQINFGPTKKGFMSYTNDPEDYIHGTISRTTTAFLAKFKSKSIGIYPTSEDIAKQISKVSGLWTENICFDDKEYMNFIKTKPYSMQDEENPLPSNSTYRLDINHWMNNQLQLAQMNKQKLQVIQRNDRKLRQTYKKKQKTSS